MFRASTTNHPNIDITVEKISLKKKVLNNIIWLSSVTFLSQLISWSVTIVIIRLLKSEDYGLFAMATLFLGFLTMLYEVGMGSAIIQKSDVSEGDLKKLAGVVIIINSGLLSFVFVTAPLVARFFSEPSLVSILRVSSINFILLSLYFIPQTIFIRELNFRTKSMIDLFANLFSNAIILILALRDFGVWALVYGMIGMQLFKALAYNCQRDLRYWPQFTLRGIRSILVFGSHVTISKILWYFYSQADILIAGRLLGKELLGTYSVAMHIVSIPLEKISPIVSQIGLPVFSRLQEDIPTIQSHLLKLLRSLNLITFPVFIGLPLVAPDAIPLILGLKWIDIVFPMQILSLTMPLRLISIVLPQVVTGIGRPDIITKNLCVAIVAMPVAFLIGSRWGMNGLCYAWLTAYPVVFIVMTKRALTAIKLSLNALLDTVLTPLLASCMMAVGLLAFKAELSGLLPALWYIPTLIITGILFYSLTILLFDRNLLKELRQNIAASGNV